MAAKWKVVITLPPRYLNEIPHFYDSHGEVRWTIGATRGYHYKKDAVKVQKEIIACDGNAVVHKL